MQRDTATEETIVAKYSAIEALLDERTRRLWAATESRAIGFGGDALVSGATGLARATIRKGRLELEAGVDPKGRVRKPGAGRPSLQQTQPGLKKALEQLVDPLTRGDPMSPLRWTCKSKAKLAAAMAKQGWKVSATMIGRLLHELGYSLKSVRKTTEGASHPDRNAQFEHINAVATDFLESGSPVISVDTKKKELVGAFKNGGREWQPKGEPEKVKVHDFLDMELGKAIPYGVYDISENQGWVSVGIDHDTARFAAEAIARWWKKMGSKRYGDAKELLITADGGGSNGSRCRLWKVALQELAAKLEMPINVCHFPPGTSKWNKIEHRMFSHITRNWRGRPLVSHEVIIKLIANTTTKTGLKIRAGLDTGVYPTGIAVTDEELAALNLKRANFHGEWNYKLLPPRNK